MLTSSLEGKSFQNQVISAMFQTIGGAEERHLKQVEGRKSQERCLSKRGRFSKGLGKRNEKKCSCTKCRHLLIW